MKIGGRRTDGIGSDGMDAMQASAVFSTSSVRIRYSCPFLNDILLSCYPSLSYPSKDTSESISMSIQWPLNGVYPDSRFYLPELSIMTRAVIEQQWISH